MASPTIGYATLQIIPSAKGMLGNVQKELGDELDDAGDKAGSSSSKAFGSSFSAGMKKAVAGGAVALAGAAVFGKMAIDAASGLAESTGKVNVVFGDAAGAVLDWSKTSATAFGASQQQALEAAGTYGNLFQAFGLGQKEALGMSTGLTELAADLASFNNTSVDEALQALQSGVSGETEPLKRYGIAINDVRLKQEAMAMGLISSTSEALTPAAKAQASYALIMKDSALAQGDFERTSDGLANQQRIMAAQFENVKAKIGQALIPAMSAAVSFIGGTVVPVIEKLWEGLQTGAEWIADNWRPIVAGLTAVVLLLVPAFISWATAATAAAVATLAAAAPVIAIGLAVAALAAGLVWAYENVDWFRDSVDRVASFLKDTLWPAIKDVFGWLSDNVPPILETIARFFTEKVVPAAQAVASFITDKLVPAFGAIIGKITEVATWVATKVSEIVGFITGIPGRISSAASTAFDAVKTAATTAKDWVRDRVDDIVGFFGGLPGRILGLAASIGSAALTIGETIIRKIGEGLSAAVGIAGDFGKAVANAAIGAVNKVIDKINSALEFRIQGPGFLPDINLDPPDIPHIPRLATGGAMFGPTLALLAEYPGAARDPEIAAPRSLLADTFRAELDRALFAGAPSSAGGAALHVEHLTVGTAADLPATRAELNVLAWQARLGVIAA